MRHTSHDPSCGVCVSISDEASQHPEALYEDDLWIVRHGDAPYGLPGWLMMMAKRHVQGPATFDDREAASFGPMLRHMHRTLLEASGALRIYTAFMGESHPHFHAHLVPRYARMPKEAKAWGAFDLQRAAIAGEITVDENEVKRISTAFKRILEASPPPRI